jgi:tRNA A-37 threonylcarbamoyl transferase component Bud32/tetratricopeptide (TPR) repeat protein
MAIEDELSTVDAELATPPSSDPIAMERARARIELAMFGVMKPPLLGRYQILDPLAGGGMGLVYAAYDPELQRRVALKVVYPGGAGDPRARDRLLREARALARLDHPNVVRVHDVLSHDGQIVVVMALLEGQTLATWERAATRSWRDVVATYLQAGEGLAAAHSVDVIHRDFKPGNAIISTSGHVRVLDFGLARMSADSFEEDTLDAKSPRISFGSPLRTSTGTFLGTFLYASPEQLAGRAVTAASDQFSFCVAMHRAVEGVAPFEGASIEDRVANIGRNEVRIAGDGRRVPAWLRQALRRGLAADPSRRYPSMRALLDELGRPRGVRRWRWPIATGALATAVAVMGFTTHAARPTCADSDRALEAVWGPSERVALVGKLASLAGPYSADTEHRVLDQLDDRAADWSRARTSVCLANANGARSDALFDREVLCLDHQLDELSSSIEAISALDGTHAMQALEVVAGLPSAGRCGDVAAFLDQPAPPATLPASVEVERIRTQLSQAAVLDRAGKTDAALAIAKAELRAAQTVRYAPVIAEAALEVGRILIGGLDPGAAIAPLKTARDAALATGKQQALLVEAFARLIYAEGTAPPQLAQLKHELEYLVPMSEALPPAERFVKALLLGNAGEAFVDAGDVDDARAYYRRAHIAAGDAPELELTSIDRNLAVVTSDLVERDRLLRSAWQRTRDELGPHHLRTLDAQMQLATLQADPAVAAKLVAPICTDYEASGTFGALAAECEWILGFVAAEAGHTDEAEAAYTRAIRQGDARLRALAGGDLALLRGELDTATSEFRALIALHHPDEQWWDHQQVLEATYGLAQIASRKQRHREAADELAVVIAGYRDIARHTPLIIYTRRADNAERQLAIESPEHNDSVTH